jgi:hypothetical protein
VRRRAAVVAVLTAVTLAACGGGQDPGVPADTSGGGPSTTSHLLSPCPTDVGATIPPEGCLDEDGKVVPPS